MRDHAWEAYRVLPNHMDYIVNSSEGRKLHAPVGDKHSETIRPDFDKPSSNDFQEAKITSDTGFFLINTKSVHYACSYHLPIHLAAKAQIAQEIGL